MSRVDELSNIADDRVHPFLAGQIDEVDDKYVELMTEVRGIRRVLTQLLVAVCVALVAFPIGIAVAVLT